MFDNLFNVIRAVSDEKAKWAFNGEQIYAETEKEVKLQLEKEGAALYAVKGRKQEKFTVVKMYSRTGIPYNVILRSDYERKSAEVVTMEQVIKVIKKM